MGINRRFFLAIASSASMDPERLLWVPGRKLISIAAPLDVVPVETLFGMPLLMPFDVPLTHRVRAMLALEPTAGPMAEGSGTVRFIEANNGPSVMQYSIFSGRKFSGRYSFYDWTDRGSMCPPRPPGTVVWPGTPT